MIRSFSSLVSTTQERIKIARTTASAHNRSNNRRPSAAFSSSISTTTKNATIATPSETMVSPSTINNSTSPPGNTPSPAPLDISSLAPTPLPRPISSLSQFRNHRKIQKMLRQGDKHPNLAKRDNSSNTITTTTITSINFHAPPTRNDHKSKHIPIDQRVSGQERESERVEQSVERARAKASTGTRAGGGSERVEVAVESITTTRFQSFVLDLFLGHSIHRSSPSTLTPSGSITLSITLDLPLTHS